MVQKTIHLEDWPIAPETPIPGSLVVWRKRLAEARERGEFTLEDIRNISSFSTCAVGEYLGFPELYHTGVGDHPDLVKIGFEAVRTVCYNDFDAFAAILDQLEAMKRSEQ